MELAPMEKEGAAGAPKGAVLKPCPWPGAPGLPKGVGPAAAALCPNAGAVEEAAAPKLNPPICAAGLLETGVPNWEFVILKLNPPGAGWAEPAGAS